MPYLSIRDLNLYFEERGRPDGQPVVLLHGAGGTADDPAAGWAGVVPTLPDDLRLLLVEHRGHGRTDNPAGQLRFDQMGDDIAALIDELDLGEVHIGGISDGGVMALDCALRRPELVRTVTVIGTNYCVDALTLGAADGIDPDDIERAAPEAAAKFAARHDGGKYPGYWKDLIEQVKANNATSPSWTTDDLGRIGCPTLLVAGENDPFANVDQMVVMKREIPGAEWLIVNDAGHAVHYEQPALVGGRIADFLRRHA